MADKQPPFVAVRTDIRKDERVLVIADVAGYNRHEAMGRLLDLWAWCSDRKLADAPDDCDGYAVPEAVVRRFLGARGVEAILGDGCDELAMGARRPDGSIYLRGTSETVSRLRWGVRHARKGGVARGGATRDHNGHYVAEDTTSQPESSLDSSPESSAPPAHDSSVTSEIPQTTNHIDTDPQPSVASPVSPEPVQAERESIAAQKLPVRTRKNKQEPTLQERAIAMRVLGRLGARNAKIYSGNFEHVKLIADRLREGYTELELDAVAADRDEVWRNKPDMREYLVPETLWGPKKIMQYIDGAKTKFRRQLERGEPIPTSSSVARLPSSTVDDEPWIGEMPTAEVIA